MINITEQERNRIKRLHKQYSLIKEDTEGEETYHYGEDEGEDRKEEKGLEHEEDMAPRDRIREIERHLKHLKDDMGYDEEHEDRDEEDTHFHDNINEQDLEREREVELNVDYNDPVGITDLDAKRGTPTPTPTTSPCPPTNNSSPFHTNHNEFCANCGPGAYYHNHVDCPCCTTTSPCPPADPNSPFHTNPNEFCYRNTVTGALVHCGPSGYYGSGQAGTAAQQDCQCCP